MSRTYRGGTQNVDLLSPYLVGISQFAKHLLGDDIREITLEKHTIIYDLQETVMLAIVTTGKRPAKRKLNTILKKLYSEFVEQYGEHLEQEIIEPEIFGKFTETMDEIMEGSGVVKS
jgi:hypothetical protein